MMIGHVGTRSQWHASRHTGDLGATVMDLARKRGTCYAHVDGLSHRYHVEFTTTWAPDPT
jgi:hypothetical protein